MVPGMRKHCNPMAWARTRNFKFPSPPSLWPGYRKESSSSFLRVMGEGLRPPRNRDDELW